MLYIWPLFAFFSAPLFIPTLLRLPPRLFGNLNSYLTRKSKRSAANDPGGNANSGSSKETRNGHASGSVSLTSKDDAGNPRGSSYLLVAKVLLSPRAYCIPLLFLIALASWLVVIKNTIIHPFTLADNRHYMFYIFRYTIRRPGHFREYLVGVYMLCGWLCWSALSPSGKTRSRDQRDNRCDNAAAEPASSSTVVLLLVATALSLVTAPLVEPRYFILPWIFWRLLVPAWHPEENNRDNSRAGAASIPGLTWCIEWGRRYDLRLVLETLWFLAINAVTMYIFISRPYVWRDENGEVLDGGRLQRFMW